MGVLKDDKIVAKLEFLGLKIVLCATTLTQGCKPAVTITPEERYIRRLSPAVSTLIKKSCHGYS